MRRRRGPAAVDPRVGLRARVRYWFDNSLTRGATSLIGWLGLASLLLIVMAALVVVAFDIQTGGGSLNAIEAGWQALLRTLDAGTMGEDVGWGFRVVMLGVTLGGVFVVSLLIGVITTSMNARIAVLRKGRSPVLETGHTLILGWSPKVFTLLAQLAVANANQARARVAILADRDKVSMEDEIRARLGGALGRMKVICRSGDPMVPADLAIANAAKAGSIVILAPDDEHSDAFTLRCLMALNRKQARAAASNHIVATVSDSSIAAAIPLVGDRDVRRISADELIARIVAQTCRQSGLSMVTVELLNFEGDEIYFQAEPDLAGRTYAEALLAYEDSSVIGLHDGSGRIRINPPMATVLTADTEVIAISADDDTIRLPVAAVETPDETAITCLPRVPPAVECTLVLGWNNHGRGIVRTLDSYVAPGSRVEVVGVGTRRAEDLALTTRLRNLTVAWHDGDPSDRACLESLELGGFDHVILLAEDCADHDDADTRTLVTLLNLRDLARRNGHRYSIVTELLDTRNRELAEASVADDFIVSDELVSLMLAQVSENPALEDVLGGLFDAEGSEIYLRPAAEYVQLGVPVSYATVVASAARRGETAIGYRCAAEAADEQASYGVAVNPPKSRRRVWTPEDRVIVLSED